MSKLPLFLPALLALAACTAAPAEDEAENGASAIGEEPFRMEVGREASGDDPILVLPRPSTRNMYALSLAAWAAGADETSGTLHLQSGPLMLRLCEAGVHVRGQPTCAGKGPFVEAQVESFATALGSDNAIYLRAPVPTPQGPKDVAILAFRGTSDLADLKTDLSFGQKDDWGANSSGGPELAGKDLPGKAHAGFDTAAARLWRGDSPSQSLRRFLLEERAKPDAPPLYVTGHSLGGAIATVVTGYLLFGECSSIAHDERFSDPRSVPQGSLAWTLPGTSCPAQSKMKIAGLYTYGSPRVGDPQFAEAVANMMALRRVAHTRVVNANDLVPRIPPRSMLLSSIRYSHLHLSIHGLVDTAAASPRRYSVVEGEEADADWGQRDPEEKRGYCRQYEGDAAAPALCPTMSLAYLLPGAAADERQRNRILRLGAGATEALDENATFVGKVGDHKLTANYVPLLRKVLPVH